jgi:hypothetical protein
MDETKRIFEIFVKGNTKFIEILQELKLFNQYLHLTITIKVETLKYLERMELVLNEDNVI